jgi:hypothetical protein
MTLTGGQGIGIGVGGACFIIILGLGVYYLIHKYRRGRASIPRHQVEESGTGPGTAQNMHELTTSSNVHELITGSNKHEMETQEMIHEAPGKEEGPLHELEGDVVYKDSEGKEDEGRGFVMTG